MSALKSIVLALIAIAAIASVPSVSYAQNSVPFVIKTYRVQVKYEMWRNGSTYWATEFETKNEDDAELMFLALETALDNGYICEVLDCGFDWIPRDVRLDVQYEYPWIEVTRYTLARQPYTSTKLYPVKR